MDKTASKDSIILGPLRKCTKNADLDSHYRICHHRDCQKEAKNIALTLQNSAADKPFSD